MEKQLLLYVFSVSSHNQTLPLDLSFFNNILLVEVIDSSDGCGSSIDSGAKEEEENEEDFDREKHMIIFVCIGAIHHSGGFPLLKVQ